MNATESLEVINRLRQLNVEMRQQEERSMNLDLESDDVIRARKEVQRIKHDIADLLNKYVAV